MDVLTDVPTSLTLDEHLSVLDTAGERLGSLATSAGLDADVPTCPGWSVRDLVAHVSTVHRWATAHVRGEDPAAMQDEGALREGVVDLLTFFDEGRIALLGALRAAPADLQAMTFLRDAPAPREFWARRQAHETMVHMVDALAAAVGRWPTAAEADVNTDAGVDGIDELLRGFFTRGSSKLSDGPELVFVAAPSDSERRWVVRAGASLTVDVGDADPGPAVPVRITGTAAQIYLALWNRGDEVQVTGSSGLLEAWRARQRVGWR